MESADLARLAALAEAAADAARQEILPRFRPVAVGGQRGGGVRCNGAPVRVSQHDELGSALVSHGDPMCFERFGRKGAFLRMAREIPMLRGYTDGFGHALVLRGAVDVMVDVSLNPWDAAASQVLVPEAGGRCVALPGPPTI